MRDGTEDWVAESFKILFPSPFRITDQDLTDPYLALIVCVESSI